MSSAELGWPPGPDPVVILLQVALAALMTIVLASALQAPARLNTPRSANLMNAILILRKGGCSLVRRESNDDFFITFLCISDFNSERANAGTRQKTFRTARASGTAPGSERFPCWKSSHKQEWQGASLRARYN